jgi:hypothetical protein
MRSEEHSELLIYTSPDGKTRIDVQLDGETVWLSQAQLAKLFQRDKSVISRHIQNVFDEGELSREGTVAKNATVQREGGRDVAREVEFYNLDVVISVGYRVKSHRGAQFRIWATQRLREYIIKGFTLDDERLKDGGTRNDYFDELIERVREIRTSERNFYRKITDIYATSYDYEQDADITHRFFATVQNKLHWAIHGHTAAELIAERADSRRPNMGLTNFRGERVRKADVTVAKNYLNTEELTTLNLLVDQYLSFAELQARQRKPMYMRDWERKLNEFLRLNEREILSDAGKISAKVSEEVAHAEFEKYSAKHNRAAIGAPVPELETSITKIRTTRKRKKPD